MSETNQYCSNTVYFQKSKIEKKIEKIVRKAEKIIAPTTRGWKTGRLKMLPFFNPPVKEMIGGGR